MSIAKELGLKSPNRINISECQRQTDQAFGFKWSKRSTYESEASKSHMKRWLFDRYCSGDERFLDEWLAGETPKIILDAGCGAGFSALLFFGQHLKKHKYLGIDISTAIDVARQRFEEHNLPGEFIRADISDLQMPDNSVDLIFSEGVLHHTDSTELTLKNLAKKLKPNGRFLFYVYRKKSVIREFTDDHIREEISNLSDEEAWEALKPITHLGIALGEIERDIFIPQDIPSLEIKKGELSLQRFFYWNICKTYYRPDLSFDEMHHINFDWFRPKNCHRHTKEEIVNWCEEADLVINHSDEQESGITIVAKKKNK